MQHLNNTNNQNSNIEIEKWKIDIIEKMNKGF